MVPARQHKFAILHHMMQIHFKPFPVLNTGRLTLRRMGNEDAEELFALRSDPEVMHYVPRPPAASIDDAYELIRKIDDSIDLDEGINWAICLNDSQTLIGTICYWRIEKQDFRAEVGYLLNPRFQG